MKSTLAGIQAGNSLDQFGLIDRANPESMD
jgi:hypothetical protein